VQRHKAEAHFSAVVLCSYKEHVAMNGKKIREAKGKHVRIRPISLRFDLMWNALP